jgi:hypothetical protein
MSFLDNLGQGLYSGASTVGTIGADIQLITVLAISVIVILVVIWMWSTGEVIDEQNGKGPVKKTKISDKGLFIIISVVLIIDLLVGLNWYFTQTYKPYAAFSGASDVARLL